MERPFSNNPHNVIANFLTSRETPVSPDLIRNAASLIKKGYPQRNALGICIDLGSESRMVTESAPVLAAMFRERHEALPSHWGNTPEIMRTVLSMAATIDLGHLQAVKLHGEHQGGTPLIDRRIEEMGSFLSDLQKRD